LVALLIVLATVFAALPTLFAALPARLAVLPVFTFTLVEPQEIANAVSAAIHAA
jgi:hypothetical protein